MFRKLAVVLVLVVVSSACGFDNRKGYYFDNHRFNYVRAEDMKGASDRNINHPFTFSEQQISTILKMIEINKGSFFSDNEKVKNIFDTYAIGKLTPPLVKAFSEITSKQKVGFSFLTKSPTFVVKNDRLTIGSMWVEDDKLHIFFDVLYVKVTGDIDKLGYTAIRQAQKAKGLRISFDLQPGQEYGSSTDELVIDTTLFAKISEERVKKEKELVAKGVDDTVKIQVVKDKSIKARLKELDTLRKEHMITEEEYEKRRKEILDQL